MGHDIENPGDTPMRFLEVFKSNSFADVSLDQWIVLTPAELVAHLKLDRQVMDALRKAKVSSCQHRSLWRGGHSNPKCRASTASDAIVSCNCLFSGQDDPC